MKTSKYILSKKEEFIMKRKISMLLSIILVATSLIACDEQTQEIDTTTQEIDTTTQNQTQTQTQSITSDQITTDEVEPEIITIDSNNNFDEIAVPVTVILENENYIEDTDNINQFWSIIENATFTDEIPVSPAGGSVFEFYVVLSDDSIREFNINSGYLFEYVESEMLCYTLSDIEDFNFIVSLMDLDIDTQTIEDDIDFEVVYAPTMSFEDAPFNSVSPDDFNFSDTEQTNLSLPPSSPPPNTPAPSEGSAGGRLTDEHDVFAVLLDDTIWIDDLEGVNKFMDIIDNTTIYEEMPISAGGSRTVNFVCMLVDDSCRIFSANGTYLTETMDSKTIYHVFNNPDDFIYLVNFVDNK